MRQNHQAYQSEEEVGDKSLGQNCDHSFRRQPHGHHHEQHENPVQEETLRVGKPIINEKRVSDIRKDGRGHHAYLASKVGEKGKLIVA